METDNHTERYSWENVRNKEMAILQSLDDGLEFEIQWLTISGDIL